MKPRPQRTDAKSESLPRQDPAQRDPDIQPDEADAVFRGIVEEQSELVSLAQADGTLAYVNPAYARHFGRSPKSLIGTDLFDLIDPQDRQAVRDAFDDVLQLRTTHCSENRMINADGQVRIVSWTNSVHQRADETPLLRSVGRDVTEQRDAEQAQRKSEAFTQAIARVSGVGGWSLDLATGALQWTEQTRRIHELSPDFELTLEAAINFYTPSSRQLIEAAIQQAVSDGTPWDLELELRTAKGRAIWARAVGEAEFENGKALRLIGTFQDITARRNMEQRVAESERFLRELTDSLPLRIAHVDTQRRYRFVNLELVRRFGRARDDIIGHTRQELLPEIDHSELAARAQAALGGQAQQFEFDEYVGTELRRIENRLTPDRAADGAVRGYFVTGIDITERSAAERAARELTAIVENTTDFVVQTDRQGLISYMNPAARSLLGIGLDDVISGRSFSQFNTAQTNALFADVILPAVKRTGVWVGQTEVYAASNREISVSHMVLAHRNAQGHIERFSAVMRDISEMVEAQREILRQSATLRSVADAMPAAVAVVSSEGRYRFVNQAFANWHQRPAQAIVGLAVHELLGDVELARRQPWIDRALAGDTVHFELDYPDRVQGAHQSFSYIPMRRSSGEPDGMVIVTNDISHQRREASRLQQLAQQDPLTGLLNRSGFEQALERIVARSRDTEPLGLALLYIDLDRFKPVNDQHGHAVGDQLLTLFGKRMHTLVRPSDVVARLGGDEFAIALPGIRELAHAQKIAAKVLAASLEAFPVGALKLQIGASIGVAWNCDASENWRELVTQADKQLLRAKAAGRGRQACAD